jgi:alpha-tubulin suppressor-like RCC1 family protein
MRNVLWGLVVAAGACGGAGANVTPMLGAAAISAGGSHTCALMIDGTPRCWGSNTFGELGTLTVEIRTSTPVPLALPGVVQIAAGGEQTCARLQDGTVDCWGRNEFGQVGNGTASPFEWNPVPLARITDAVWVGTTGPSVAGESTDDDYSCAILAAGRVACWGDDSGGEIGDGTNQRYVPSPSLVSGLEGVQSLSLGGRRVYAVLADGTVTAWGSDFYASSILPVAVPGLSGVVSVAAAEAHACALLSDGTVACWGDDLLGEVGSGAYYGQGDTPVAVPGLTGVVALSAGGSHNCALLGDGTARCWGSDMFGQLGDNGRDDQATPVPVLGLSDAVALSSGPAYTCALLSDTSIRCWGINESGQLGNDGTSQTGVHVAVSVVEPKP